MRAEDAMLTSPRLLTDKAAEAQPELSLPALSSPRAAGAGGSVALARGGGRDPPLGRWVGASPSLGASGWGEPGDSPLTWAQVQAVASQL